MGSHFQTFPRVREELRASQRANLRASSRPFRRRRIRCCARRCGPRAASGSRTRTPPRPSISRTRRTALMLRLIAYAYMVPRPSSGKDRWRRSRDRPDARRHAPRRARCAAARWTVESRTVNAGMSFTVLRDARRCRRAPSARCFSSSGCGELATAAGGREPCANELALPAYSPTRATRRSAVSAVEPRRGAGWQARQRRQQAPGDPVAARPCVARHRAGELGQSRRRASRRGRCRRRSKARSSRCSSKAAKCIHARFCVTGAPNVFLANVKGPWIHPDAHATSSASPRSRTPALPARSAIGARTARADETAPPVNLIAIREARALRGTRRTSVSMARRSRFSRDAVPLRRIEEQAVLRRLAP